MSDLSPAALSYRTVVTEYFLALRGVGLMLSPLDDELVRAWELRGLPVAVVCAGLRQGVEDARRSRPPGSPAPRALRAYRASVESAWRAHRAGRVGSSPPPPDEGEASRARLAAARELLAAAERGAPAWLRPVYAGAERLLVAEVAAPLSADGPGITLAGGPPAATLAGVEALLQAVEARLLRRWLACLPRAERAALGPRCRLRAGFREPRVRRTSYREALRSHLADAAREAGLLRLRGSV